MPLGKAVLIIHSAPWTSSCLWIGKAWDTDLGSTAWLYIKIHLRLSQINVSSKPVNQGSRDCHWKVPKSVETQTNDLWGQGLLVTTIKSCDHNMQRSAPNDLNLIHLQKIILISVNKLVYYQILKCYQFQRKRLFYLQQGIKLLLLGLAASLSRKVSAICPWNNLFVTTHPNKSRSTLSRNV